MAHAEAGHHNPSADTHSHTSTEGKVIKLIDPIFKIVGETLEGVFIKSAAQGALDFTNAAGEAAANVTGLGGKDIKVAGGSSAGSHDSHPKGH